MTVQKTDGSIHRNKFNAKEAVGWSMSNGVFSGRVVGMAWLPRAGFRYLCLTANRERIWKDESELYKV